ncbi:MAG: hypothetical protein AAF998_12605 [Bacteroidota bacterium]
MNKLKIDDLFIPTRLVKVMHAVLNSPKAEIEEGQGSFFRIQESVLIELFLAAGAIQKPKNEKMNENELIVDGEIAEVNKTSDNQYFDTTMPQVLIEDRENPEGKLVRAIMEHGNLSLKVVAERYGGKSGAANVANFMAKTNRELATMRASTRRKLATALGCPEKWLTLRVADAVDPDGKEE